ncbi:MAG: LAGLIDADG family homing endonuclease [Candidatus Diapherotrites archaeon]
MAERRDDALNFNSTAELKVSEKLVDQVIGQDNSVEIVKKAAAQKRNMLLVGLPGTGKCLTADTELLLGDGLIISCEELYPQLYDASEVESKNEKMVVLKVSNLSPNVSSLVKGAKEKFWIRDSRLLRISKEKFSGDILLIKTASGRKIKVTENHKLLSVDENGFLLKKAKELSSRDHLAVPSKLTLLDEKPTETNVLLPLPPEGIFKKIKVPTKLTIEMAAWLGHLIAEGSFCRNQIRFTSAEQHKREFFKELTERIFDIKPYMKGKDVFINSVELLTYLREILRIKTTNARNKEIPVIIMRAPLRIIKSFLARLFADDGSFYRNCVELACSNEKMASQILYLLLHFGIVARLKEKKDSKTKWTYYRIFIQGEFLDDFMKKIGFVNRKKFGKLQKYISEKKFNTNVDIIPFVGKLIKRARLARSLTVDNFSPINSSMICRYENGKRNPSKKALIKIVNVLDKRLPLKEDDCLPLLKTLAFSNIFWDKIIEVKEVNYEGYVYDIEIEADSHVFVAGFGGLFSHNSMLAQAMAEILPVSELHDILIYPNRSDPNNPRVREVKAGEGKKIVQKARMESRAKEDNARFMGFILPLGFFIIAGFMWRPLNWIPDVVYAATLILGGFLMIGFALGSQMRMRSGTGGAPKLLVDNSGKKTAPFTEGTGARAGALLGDVRHDPLQSFIDENKLVVKSNGFSDVLSFESLWKMMTKKYPELIEKHENGYEAIVFPENEKVFTVGFKDGKVVESRILSINRKPYDGEVIEISAENSKLTVTPEHKIFTGFKSKEAEKILKNDNLIKLVSKKS